MLKTFYAKKEDIPQGLEEHYEEAAEGWVLKTEDGDYKKKLDEFRTNNRSLFAEKQELNKKMALYEGIDPAKYKDLQSKMAKLEKLEDAELLKEGDLDAVIQKRTKAMKDEYESTVHAKDVALKETKSKETALRTELERLKIDGALRSTIEGKKLKVRAGAMEDIMRRGRDTWRIDDKGGMLPVSPDGTKKFGKEGEVLSMEEFIANMASAASHLFEASGGGGGGDGDRNTSPKDRNGKKVIHRSDKAAMRANLEKIASGEVEVID
tara:strand:- start:1896 stop:2693 length:798 start_codon:yes stop_codon:yes gene_type:complete